MKASSALAFFFLAANTYCQTPAIAPHGIVNAGSFTSGLPGGSIARGSVFTLFGSNLGPAALAQQPSLPLSTTLAGASR